MWKRIFFLSIILIFVGATSLTIAQSGGSFDLTWNSIDGGGQTSSGGNFILDGTIGQPDAGLLSGSTFDLNGGFQQCLSDTSTPMPSIAQNSTDIEISWVGSSVNVYRATNAPYFTPSTPYANNVISTWSDSGAAVPTNNYTYLIRALGDCGESSNSIRMATFHFDLTPGD